jgi:hypothetical protein
VCKDSFSALVVRNTWEGLGVWNADIIYFYLRIYLFAYWVTGTIPDGVVGIVTRATEESLFDSRHG